ncbi:hypothetical protein MTO96_017533 [Rhipicephalus appendiculatus]
MAPTMSYILLVFGVALLPAVNGQCINVTLPNILNLGECLGTTLRACPDTSSGLIPDLTRVLGCVLQILPQIGSPVSVLYNVVGLLEAVVSRLGLSADIGGLTDILCNPLGIPLFSCGTFSPGNIACRGTAPDQPAQRLQHRSVSEPDPLVLRRRINNFGETPERTLPSSWLHSERQPRWPAIGPGLEPGVPPWWTFSTHHWTSSPRCYLSGS